MLRGLRSSPRYQIDGAGKGIGRPVRAVQHHAHIVPCLAENDAVGR